MADLLTPKSPCAGLLPLTIGTVTAEEIDPGALSLVMPFAGQAKACSDAMKAAHGIALPGQGRSTGKDGARAIWFGRAQIMLAGIDPAPLAGKAAVSDQSDGWACVALSGAHAGDVLARLVPVDLRAGVFKKGHTARTQIQHMNGSVTRTGPDSFLVMVFRSMAGTLVHDLTGAMETVAARH